MKIKSTLIVLGLAVGLISCSYNSGVLKNAEPIQQNATLKTASAQGPHMFLKAVNNTEFVAGGGTLIHIDLVEKGNSNKEKRVPIYDSTWTGSAEHFNDLLDMSTGIMMDVAGGLVPIPAGSYDYAVATVVPGSGWLKDKDGNVYPVKFPGNKFKLAFKPAIIITDGGVSTDVVLQIDINKSFVLSGKSFIFKPVVKVVNATVNGSLVGGVYTYNATYSGVVPVPDATISLDGNPVFTTYSFPITDPATGYTLNPGEYWVPGIPAGTYTASASADGYATASAQVTIVEGNFTQQVFILTPQ